MLLHIWTCYKFYAQCAVTYKQEAICFMKTAIKNNFEGQTPTIFYCIGKYHEELHVYMYVYDDMLNYFRVPRDLMANEVRYRIE